VPAARVWLPDHMNARKPIGVGVVGWGFASTTFHAPLIRATPGMKLVAVSSSRADELTQTSPSFAIEPTPGALFARNDIDLVVIPTPNDTHYPLAAQALAACKHVVVDKPFTLSVDEADDLIARAQQANRLLSVFHNRRWDGDFLGLQEVLNSGVLGRVTHFESHFDRYRPQVRQRWRESASLGSGLWYDLGPHLLDQTLQLFGPPQALWLDTQAQRDDAVADDWFHCVLRYPALRVVLHASALTASVAPRFVVHGTAGSYTKHGLDTQEDALKAGRIPGDAAWGSDPLPGALLLQMGEQLVHSPGPSVPGNYLRYYAGIRDALLHDHPLPVTAADARTVMQLIELGRQSQQSGSWSALV
jgi:scyllo-inositol 2-dehydrogenase (NADP+)